MFAKSKSTREIYKKIYTTCSMLIKFFAFTTCFAQNCGSQLFMIYATEITTSTSMSQLRHTISVLT